MTYSIFPETNPWTVQDWHSVHDIALRSLLPPGSDSTKHHRAQENQYKTGLPSRKRVEN